MVLTVEQIPTSREHPVLDARGRLGMLEALRQHAQPEAMLAALALREPWQLEAGGQLADLMPDEFRARPEYGAVLDVVRSMLELYAAATVARECSTNPVLYFADLAQLALALWHDGPVAYNVAPVIAGIRERNRLIDEAITTLDAVRAAGVVMELARVEPPHEEAVLVPGRRYEPAATAESTARELEALREQQTAAWDALAAELHTQRVDREVSEHLYSLRECDRIARMAFYEGTRQRVDVLPTPCGTRSCRGCGARIAERIVQAIDAHGGPVFHTIVTAPEREALVKRIRRAGALYKLFPAYDDGRALVVTTLEGVGPELYREELPDLIARAFAAVPAGRNISGSNAWSHAAATVKRRRAIATSTTTNMPTMTTPDEATTVDTTPTPENMPTVQRDALGRVRVSVLAERTAAVELTGQAPEEHGAAHGLEEHQRRRRYAGVTPEIRDELVRRWNVQSPEEFAAERAAGRTLTRAKARDLARRAV